MDEQSQKYLNEILAKEPGDLTPEQVGFLKARISYVGRNSRAKFAEVLTAETPQEPNAPQTLTDQQQQTGEGEKKTTDTAQYPADQTGSQADSLAGNPSTQVDDDGEDE